MALICIPCDCDLNDNGKIFYYPLFRHTYPFAHMQWDDVLSAQTQVSKSAILSNDGRVEFLLFIMVLIVATCKLPIIHQ